MDRLSVLPYHQNIANYLENNEKGLWDWFQSDDFSQQYKAHVKLELLKTSYRLQESQHKREYELAKQAMAALEISLPLTLYQMQSNGSSEHNAALVYLRDEIAMMVTGSLFELLDDQELLAIFGHELSHHLFYVDESERYFHASRLLEWCAEHDNSRVWIETERRYRLFTEIYADRGGLIAVGSRTPLISSLIKTMTGLKTVDADAYLQQAEEVLDKTGFGSEGMTHPEIYIRAKVSDLFAQKKPDMAQINQLVEGQLSVHQLDINGQKILTDLTNDLLLSYGSQALARTESVEIHIKRFFPLFQWPIEFNAETYVARLKTVLKQADPSVAEYMSYVLLDLVTCSLEDDPIALAWSLKLAESIGLFKTYEPIARKQLKRKKADLVKLSKMDIA